MSMKSRDEVLVKFPIGLTSHSRVVEFVEVVADVVSDVAVPPTLLQHNDIQVLAFFDAERVLTIASRNVNGLTWNFQKLDSTVGWDSHNYVDLGFDSAGSLHVAGNMHASQLQYWVVDTDVSPQRVKRVGVLVEENRERRVTYPRFLRTTTGELLFTYRDGISGDGDYIMLSWDDDSRRYRCLSDGPLVGGSGKRNAYLDTNAPILGPDGVWHLLWVWRDSPDAESTHTVNYARSNDLRTWTSVAGSVLARPIVENSESVVDPVPPGRGLINNNVRLGFFCNGHPVALYHKRDEHGSQQVWAAAFDGSHWRTRRLTGWTFRWDFEGQGSLDFQIEIGVPTAKPNGLTVDIRRGEVVETFVLDDALTVTSVAPAAPWSPLMRKMRPDGLYDRCTAGRSWRRQDRDYEWFISHASVPDHRDQKPSAAVPLVQPLSVIGTAPLARHMTDR